MFKYWIGGILHLNITRFVSRIQMSLSKCHSTRDYYFSHRHFIIIFIMVRNLARKQRRGKCVKTKMLLDKIQTRDFLTLLSIFSLQRFVVRTDGNQNTHAQGLSWSFRDPCGICHSTPASRGSAQLRFYAAGRGESTDQSTDELDLTGKGGNYIIPIIHIFEHPFYYIYSRKLPEQIYITQFDITMTAFCFVSFLSVCVWNDVCVKWWGWHVKVYHLPAFQ